MSDIAASKALNEALEHHRAGRLEQAETAYVRCQTLAPKLWQAWHHAGLLSLLQGQPEVAARRLEQAATLRTDPAESLIVLGAVLVSLHRSEAALRTLKEAVRLAPTHFLAWDKLGMAHRAAGELPAALHCHREALRLKPDSCVAWASLGTSFEHLGQYEEALHAYEKATRFGPSDQTALMGLATCLYKVGRLSEAGLVQDRILRLNPGAWQIRSQRLLSLNFDDTIAKDLVFAQHKAFGLLASQHPQLPPPSQGRRPGPPRVGFLSPDLWNHPVGRFMEPLLERASAEGFELYLYSDTDKRDELQERLRCLAEAWYDCHFLSDKEVFSQCRKDDLDLLLELAGHTAGNRLPLLTARLAPVQLSYLGYPNTTGLSSIDYRLVDGTSDPEGDSDPFYTEKLLRFSPSAWCFRPQKDSPPPGPRPEAPVFGCFNQSSKLSDALLQQWAMLLAEVPDSRLLLKSYGLDHAAVSAPLRTRMARAGIHLDRVILRGLAKTQADHLAQYTEISVALDTSPYNGTTTTCDALWMGVPVVTLRGDRHVSRVGASLLNALGQPAWIASSWEDYRAIAKGLLSTPLRGPALRERLQASLLMNESLQQARFWSALREVHTRHVRPDHT